MRLKPDNLHLVVSEDSLGVESNYACNKPPREPIVLRRAHSLAAEQTRPDFQPPRWEEKPGM